MTATALDIELWRCQGCGTLHEQPPAFCSVCLAQTFDAHAVPGRGRVVSWTTIRKPPLALRDQGPYHVAVIELDAGLRVTARLQLPDAHATPAGVGASVHLTHRVDGVGQLIHVFQTKAQSRDH